MAQPECGQREITNNRPVPEEWDGLLWRGVDGQLDEAVASLDDERLMANCYYGMGQVMCRMAADMAEPAVRQSVAGAFADAWLVKRQRHHLPQLDTICIAEIANVPLIPVMQAITQEAMASVEPGSRTLANGLAGEVELRRRLRSPAAAGHEAYPLSPNSEAAGDAVVPLIGKAAMAASTALYREALVLRLAHERFGYSGSGSMAQIKNLQSLPTGLLSPDNLAAEGLKSALVPFAGLRFDEFMDVDIRLPRLSIDQAGNLHFERAYLASEPADNPHDAQLLHKQRLTCPALQVPGFVGIGLQLVPQAVQLANRRLTESKM
jgi:hypothetical protein